MDIILENWKICRWKFTVLICILNSFNGYAQVENNKSSFGFVISGINDQLLVNNNQLQVNNNYGFGIGALYQRELSSSIMVNIQAYTDIENHQLVHQNVIYTLHENGIGVPVTIEYNLFGTGLAVFTGAEYLHIFNQKSPEVMLEKNNFNALLGLNYTIKFADFRMVPEIKYGLGLNNSIQNIAIKNYSDGADGKRSVVTFTIKLM